MARDWESQFRTWAQPPGSTEQERCDNAVSAIQNAIRKSDKLRARNISVFPQGSYRNNTNVRGDSDVDIGILCADSFFFKLPEGTTRETFNIGQGTYYYDQFKNEVEEALVNYFGRSAVTRGNKAFDIHETSYHVEADVAAFFDYRYYFMNGSWEEGVSLYTDKEKRRIVNWPEQHYNNGVDKNTQTGKRFKSIVRILKALSVEMTEAGISGGDIPGFLIECLVWNVPNRLFWHPTFSADVESALISIYQSTETDEKCQDWREVNNIKYLFHFMQKWTRSQANEFAVAAWNHVGFRG